MSESPILPLRTNIGPKITKNEPIADLTKLPEKESSKVIWQKKTDNRITVQELCLRKPCQSKSQDYFKSIDLPRKYNERNMSGTMKILEATMGKDSNNKTKLPHRTVSEKDAGFLSRSKFGLFFKSDSRKGSLKRGSRSRSRSKIIHGSGAGGGGKRVGKRIQADRSNINQHKRDVGINRQDTLFKEILETGTSNFKRTVSEPSRSSETGERIFSFSNIVNSNPHDGQQDWQIKLAKWAASLEEAISVIQREQDLKEHISLILRENKSLHSKFESMNLECDQWKSLYLQAERELKMRDAITSRCIKCDSMHSMQMGIDEFPELSNGVNPHLRMSQEDVLQGIRGLERQLGQINARLVIEKKPKGECCYLACV